MTVDFSPTSTLIKRNLTIPIGALLFAFGLVFGSIFLGAGLLVRSETRPYEDGVTVEGVVVGREVDNEGLFSSVVEFQTLDTGETFTVEGSFSSSSSPTIGDGRTVSFPTGSPSEGRVIEDQWFPWVFIGIGAAVLLFVVLGVCNVALRLLQAARGVVATLDENRLVDSEEVPSVDVGSRPIGDVYRPFGQDDDPIQDGPIAGGPLE